MFNGLFDAEQVVYDTNYDNSLDFSSAFGAYIDALSDRLLSTYSLRNKRIVSIGCGNGACLKSLCRKGSATGAGYDPSFPGDSSPVPGVNFHKKYFGPADAEQGFDFVSCRHVLEHIPRPLEFLLDLHRMGAVNPAATYYFEVPNGEFVLGGDGVWDVIYPHVCYFTEASLRALFERAGFEVMQSGKAFSDQFLFIEARRSCAKRARCGNEPVEGKTDLSHEIASFSTEFERTVRDWSACLVRLALAQEPFAFWGAGAKGVTFLNVVPEARNIANVIDSNTRKQQMFVPGTGQRILGIDALRELAPSTIILLNAAYEQEIGELLTSQGIAANIITKPTTVVGS